MTTSTSLYDSQVAAEADATIRAALTTFTSGTPTIAYKRRGYQVVVVAAPAGAGKTTLVCTAVCTVVADYAGRSRVVAVAAPTNEQVFDLIRALSPRLGTAGAIAHVTATKITAPPDILALPNVVQASARDVAHGDFQVLVGTADKLGDANARGDLPTHRYLILDEAYQADSAHYYSIAELAPRHLLVGDPGQLDPFTTMPDGDRWRGLEEDPLLTAVGSVQARWGNAVHVFRLPITRRLPASAVDIVSSFYPDHNVRSWTLPDVRRMRAMPSLGSRSGDLFDAAVDGITADGWGYVQLPAMPTLTADPEMASTIVGIVDRLFSRDVKLASETTRGVFEPLQTSRVAVAVSHNDQVDLVGRLLGDAGRGEVKVSTANKMQGLEYDLVVAWHPLTGQLTSDDFHLDPGRLCVMLTRHRHGCVVVGRVGDADLLGPVPPLSDAWAGFDDSPHVDGWFAHRRVLDELAAFAIRA